MPAVLSTLKARIYGREWSFPYNCYEVGHAWTPYCSGAACDVGIAAFKNALPLYSSLYLFTQLGLQRKYNPEAFMETFKSILISSFFIGFNLFSGMCISCGLRNNSDRYYYRIQCLTPPLIASYLSLLIERPSRRPALAFYIANMSSELLWKFAVSEGYAVAIPHGETVLFSLGMACWLRFARIHGFNHDPVSTALKYLIGPHEAKSRARKKKQVPAIEAAEECHELAESQKLLNQEVVESEPTNQECPRQTKSALTGFEENITQIFNQYFNCYEFCPHKGISCVDYVITPSITRFAYGYVGRSLLNLASQYRTLMSDPRLAFANAFKSRNSVNFGLFLGTFVGLSKGTNCVLRRIQGRQEVWHSAMAGALSGISMLFAPRSTLSTYVIWKCLEQYFFLAVEQGKIKRVNEIIGLVYAVSINVLLYMFAIEPRLIRPSYMKFIDRISDHRLHQLNRMVLDIFGPNASQGYEDWFPDLDPKYLSREFYELIFNWMILPGST